MSRPRDDAMGRQGNDDPEPEFPPRVAGCLLALSNATQKYTMYPPGHPALRTAAEAALGPVQAALEEDADLSIAVAARQVEVGGVESDPAHPRYSALAGQLHRHQLAVVTLTRGLEEEELAEFLEAVGKDPEKGDAALGALPADVLPRWPHLQVQPLRFDRLGIAGDETGGADDQRRERATSLWLGLARAIVVSDSVSDGAPGDVVEGLGSLDGPEDVARAVEQFSGRRAYSEAFMGHLGRVSRELRKLPEDTTADVKEQLARLVSLIEPETLSRMLREGSDREGRRDLVLDCSQWLEPDAMMRLLEATADVDDRELSRSLMLMLTKLARHTTSSSAATRMEARATLREQMQALLADESAGSSSRVAQGGGLERMARFPRRGGRPWEASSGVEPDRLVEIGLAADALGPAVRAAAREMTEGGRLAELLTILDRAPGEGEAAATLWSELAGPDALRRLLSDPDPDFDLVDRVLQQAGPGGVGPLLEALSAQESRAVRRKVYSRLVQMGPDIGPHVLEYLDDDRWFVLRNMLALMSELERWPSGWSPERFGAHPHPAVRREALRMMLRVAEARDRAVCGLLEDRDPRALALGLAAAQKGAPKEAVPLLLDLLGDEALTDDVRAMAVRALAPFGARAGAEPLLAVVARDGAWLSRMMGGTRLAEKSPLVLEALALLRTHHKDHPEARKVLARASRSDDPQIRAAARGRSGP